MPSHPHPIREVLTKTPGFLAFSLGSVFHACAISRSHVVGGRSSPKRSELSLFMCVRYRRMRFVKLTIRVTKTKSFKFRFACFPVAHAEFFSIAHTQCFHELFRPQPCYQMRASWCHAARLRRVAEVTYSDPKHFEMINLNATSSNVVAQNNDSFLGQHILDAMLVVRKTTMLALALAKVTSAIVQQQTHFRQVTKAVFLTRHRNLQIAYLAFDLSCEILSRTLFPQALCAVFSYRVGEWLYIVSCTKPMLVCKAVTAPCSCHLVKVGDSWCNGLLHHSARLETEHGAQTAATSAHAHGKPLHV